MGSNLSGLLQLAQNIKNKIVLLRDIGGGGGIIKLSNTILLHAGLNKEFFYYVEKYAQRIHVILPVKDFMMETTNT